jgi:hypothetical protein
MFKKILQQSLRIGGQRERSLKLEAFNVVLKAIEGNEF